MRKVVLGVLTAALAASAAAAADFPRPYSPYPAATVAASPWIGPYLGINLGYQWGGVSNSTVRPSGLMGGLQGGYNWQSGQFVFGAEADIQLSGAESVFAARKFSNPWFGTVRGRGGYVFSNVLAYGTLGLAYGGARVERALLSESHTHMGWAIGAGLETSFAPNWTARMEYLYLDLFRRLYTITGQNHGFHSNIVRFGINYRF
jgi:outer membrane immunogenic protein